MTYICPLLGHAYTIYEKVTVQWTDGTSCEEITTRGGPQEMVDQWTIHAPTAADAEAWAEEVTTAMIEAAEKRGITCNGGWSWKPREE
jgi:hypothetical protein